MKTCECGSFWGPGWDHEADCRRWPGSEWDRDRNGNPGVGGDVPLLVTDLGIEERLWTMGFGIFTPEQVAEVEQWPDRS